MALACIASLISTPHPIFTLWRPQRWPLNLHMCCSLGFKYPFHHPLSPAPMLSLPRNLPSFPSEYPNPLPPSGSVLTSPGWRYLYHALSPVTAGLVCSLGVGGSPLDGDQGFYLKPGSHMSMRDEEWLCKLGTTPLWPHRAFSLGPCL